MATMQFGMKPPPGVEPNFEHPQGSLYSWDLATQTLCIVFTTFFYVLRMYTRIHIHKCVNREDCEHCGPPSLSANWNLWE